MYSTSSHIVTKNFYLRTKLKLKVRLLLCPGEVERVVIDTVVYLYKEGYVREVVEEFDEASVFVVHVITHILYVLLG